MTRREFAERYVLLADDYEYECYSVSTVLENIHNVEDALFRGETTGLIEWLESEIEEYDDGDTATRYHVEVAKLLLETLKNGDIYAD